MAMLKESGTQKQDEVWHRGLVILDELELDIDDLPKAIKIQGYRKIAGLTKNSEVRNLAEKLATRVEQDK